MTQGSWTLNLNGNTPNQTEEGGTTNALTIANDQAGLQLTPSANFTAITAIIRCSNLDVNINDGTNQVLFAIRTSGTAERIGLYQKGSDKTLRGLWNGGVYDNVAGPVLSASPSTLAFAYLKTASTTGYAIGDTTLSYNATGLKGSNDSYNGLSIGGIWSARSVALKSATNMTITAIAIFDSQLSQTDIASYKFPSEILDFTASNEISGDVNWSEIKFKEGDWQSKAGSTATLTLSGDTVITLSDDFQAQTVTVNGAYKLTLKGGKTYFDLVGSALTGVEREVFYSTIFPQTIAANQTYLVGTDVTLSGANTVAEGGTLKVTNGTAKVAFASTGVSGTLEIAEGATLTATSGDALNYNGDTVSVNVYGTLDMGTVRWTCPRTLDIYGNGQITGTGDEHGALDLFKNGGITAHKGDDATALTPAVTAKVRYRGVNVVNVEEGVTLSLGSGVSADGYSSLTKSGTGTLKLTEGSHPFTTISAGTVELACDNALSGTSTVADGATIKVSSGTNDLTSHTINGTVTVAGGTVTVASSLAGSLTWTGGTLKVAVTADEATTGLKLGEKFTLKDGGNVIFVLPSGEEETGEGGTLTPVATWVGGASGDWATASNWNGGVVPTAAQSVVITNEGVTITVASTDAMPKRLDIMKQATLTGTVPAIDDIFVASDASLTVDGTATVTTLEAESGATLTLNGTVTATTCSISSDATLTVNGTATVTSLSGEGTLALEEGATIAPPTNTTLVDFFANWTGAVSGKGALKYTSLPGNATVQTYLQNADKWTATIAFEGLSNLQNVNLNLYGNANSTIRMTGCSMYFIQSNGTSTYRTFNPTLELCNGSQGYGVKVTNGWSGDIIEFAKLTGDGTFWMEKPSGAPTRRFFFPDLSGFAGAFKMTTSSNASTLYLGRGRDGYSNDTGDNGKIVICGEVPAAVSVTNAVGNVVFRNTPKLTCSATAKISCVDYTIDDGVTLSLATSLTDLTGVDLMPVISCTGTSAKPSLTTALDDTLPAKRWRVSQRTSGLYVSRIYGTMILVK